MTQHEWYYATDGNQMGPVGSDELKRLAASGELKAGDLVWREGLSDWTAASTIAGLFPAATPVAAHPVAAPHQRAPEAYPAAPTPAAPAYATPAPSNVLPYGGGGYGAAGAGVGVTPRTVDLLGQTRPWCLLIAVLMFLGAGIVMLVGLGIFIFGLFGSMAGPRGAGMLGVMGSVMGLFMFGMALLVFFPAMYLARYASRIAQLRGSGSVNDLEAALEAQKSYWKFIGIMTVIWIVIQVGMLLLQIVGLALL